MNKEFANIEQKEVNYEPPRLLLVSSLYSLQLAIGLPQLIFQRHFYGPWLVPPGVAQARLRVVDQPKINKGDSTGSRR